jgi:hypothetical protein
MELEEFIQSSLLQIMRGITAARLEWDRAGNVSGDGVISPAWDSPEYFKNRVQEVKFDVAVTAATKTEGAGTGGVRVVALDLTGKIGRSTENSTVSRISFSIPILPSITTIKKHN